MTDVTKALFGFRDALNAAGIDTKGMALVLPIDSAERMAIKIMQETATVTMHFDVAKRQVSLLPVEFCGITIHGEL